MTVQTAIITCCRKILSKSQLLTPGLSCDMESLIDPDPSITSATSIALSSQPAASRAQSRAVFAQSTPDPPEQTFTTWIIRDKLRGKNTIIDGIIFTSKLT